MSERDIDTMIDELVQREVNRRQLLRLGAAGAMSVGAAGLLAACGSGSALSGGTKTVSKVIPKGQIGTQLNFSNWPLYIDVSHGKHPTLDHFQKQFGVHVKYTEEINDNTEFFGKVRQQLANGTSGGRDIIVMTDWMAGKMIKLGYVEKLNKAALPNVQKNLIPALQHIDFDPNRDYSVPWQSGQTGLIIRQDKVGNVTSVNDIFNPKFKGKVTMLTEMRDSVGLTMLGMGKDPTNGSLNDMLAAVNKIDANVKNGQIRRFTGNDYLKDLPHGDTWIAYGWSGDAVQLQSDNKNIKFVHPAGGLHVVDRQHDGSGGGAACVHGRGVHELDLPASGGGADRGLRELRAAGERHEAGAGEDRSRHREESADLPDAGRAGEGSRVQAASPCRRGQAELGLPEGHRRVADGRWRSSSGTRGSCR